MATLKPIDPKVAAALERYIADQPGPVTGPQAIWIIVKLWLDQNGYMDNGPAKPH